MNCFGWYVLGQLATSNSRIQSVDVGTISVMEDLNTLLQQDLIGVKPTELCTCSESELRENRYVKSLSESTTMVDGRIQIKMPWKEDGPPRHSNYDIALKRTYSTERSFQRKDCTEIIDEEVQKLVSQSFVTKIPPEKVDHTKSEWYLPLQAVSFYCVPVIIKPFVPPVKKRSISRLELLGCLALSRIYDTCRKIY